MLALGKKQPGFLVVVNQVSLPFTLLTGHLIVWLAFGFMKPVDKQL